MERISNQNRRLYDDPYALDRQDINGNVQPELYGHSTGDTSRAGPVSSRRVDDEHQSTDNGHRSELLQGANTQPAAPRDVRSNDHRRDFKDSGHREVSQAKKTDRTGKQLKDKAVPNLWKKYHEHTGKVFTVAPPKAMSRSKTDLSEHAKSPI